MHYQIEMILQNKKKKWKILIRVCFCKSNRSFTYWTCKRCNFGDSLARVGKYLGYDITTEYYINDAGAQMDLLGLSVSLAARDFILKKCKYPETYYRGDYLIDIANVVIEKFGKDIIYDESKYKEIAFLQKI